MKYKKVLRGLSNNLQTRASLNSGGFNLYHRGHHNSFTSPRNIFYELSVAQARNANIARFQKHQKNHSQLQVTSKRVQPKANSTMSVGAALPKTRTPINIGDEDLLSDKKINLLIQEASSLALLADGQANYDTRNRLDVIQTAEKETGTVIDPSLGEVSRFPVDHITRKPLMGSRSHSRSASSGTGPSEGTTGRILSQAGNPTLLQDFRILKASKPPTRDHGTKAQNTVKSAIR